MKTKKLKVMACGHTKPGFCTDECKRPSIEEIADSACKAGGGCKRHPQHTPTPWRYLNNGDSVSMRSENGYEIMMIADHKRLIPSQADAEFIVRAVNGYDALVATLQHIQDLAEENTHSVQDGYCQIAEWARNAVAKAEAKPEGK